MLVTMLYCTQDEDGNWDGLVGELVNRRADIAVGAIRWVTDVVLSAGYSEYCAVSWPRGRPS